MALYFVAFEVWEDGQLKRKGSTSVESESEFTSHDKGPQRPVSEISELIDMWSRG